MINNFWNKLDKRQRYLVAGTAVFVLIALLLEIVFFPFWKAKERLTKAIQTNQRKLAETSDAG